MNTTGPISKPPTPEVLAALRELQAEYGKVLPTLVATLASTLERAKGEQPEEGALEEVRLQAHRLRGTAGSYGFRDVGDAAIRIEETVRVMQQGGGGALPGDPWLELESAMEAMTAAAKRAEEESEAS
jgi:HPt (histidine-containing phosphotransfer) domain-containing protein